MAPFGPDFCPVCHKTTTQHWLLEDSGSSAGGITAICEECRTVLSRDDAGLVGQRPPTQEECELIPPRVEPDAETQAAMLREWERSRVELRSWMDAGRPGLTSEIEAALPPGTRGRLRRFVDNEPPSDQA